MLEKQLFTTTMQAIETQMRLDIANAEKLAEVFPEGNSANFLHNNNEYLNALVTLLQELMNDNHANSWIEHYMYELDFGKESYRLPIKVDGKVVPMDTPEDLYEFLTNSINKK